MPRVIEGEGVPPTREGPVQPRPRSHDLLPGLGGRLLEERHEDPVPNAVVDLRSFPADHDDEIEVRELPIVPACRGSVDADRDEIPALPRAELSSDRPCEAHPVDGHAPPSRGVGRNFSRVD